MNKKKNVSRNIINALLSSAYIPLREREREKNHSASYTDKLRYKNEKGRILILGLNNLLLVVLKKGRREIDRERGWVKKRQRVKIKVQRRMLVHLYHQYGCNE